MNYFVTAIGTDSGKTLVSAILCEALYADYWKPIQAGLPRDTETVKQLITNEKTVLHNEAWLLSTPVSPHAAAIIDKVNIRLTNIAAPQTKRDLIIEGAGGCLVPINDDHYVIDIAATCKASVILVANLYLGSINHTLLTFEALKRRNIPIKGLIFNGNLNEASQTIILNKTQLTCLLHIKQEPVLNKKIVQQYAEQLRSVWS